MQLKLQRCPLCGAPAEQHSQHDLSHGQSVDQLRAACQAEVQKIAGLRADLENELTKLNAEEEILASTSGDLEQQIATLTKQIEESLHPVIEAASVELQNLNQKRQAIAGALVLFEELASLRKRLQQIHSELSALKGVKAVRSYLTTSEATNLCQTIEAVLIRWHYPDTGDVTFSEEKQDLVISGKDRGSQGKGFRAVTLSAFLIGLMEYCFVSKLPHPGFVVLDSPLVTYKKPNVAPGEAISADIQSAFYGDLRGHSQGQVIVLENEYPIGSVQQAINYVEFTKSGTGRYGFFPQR